MHKKNRFYVVKFGNRLLFLVCLINLFTKKLKKIKKGVVKSSSFLENRRRDIERERNLGGKDG